MLVHGLVLLLVSTILLVAGRLLMSFSWSDGDGEVPLVVGVPVSLGAFSIIILAAKSLAKSVELYDSSLGLAFVATIVISAPPVILYVHIVTSRLVGCVVDCLFGLSNRRSPLVMDFGVARAHARRNDVNGAIAKYRDYFLREPQNPAPLFLAATLLEQHGRVKDARSTLRDIMTSFRSDDKVWAEAEFRLSYVEEQKGDDDMLRTDLLRAVVRRIPDKQLARMARERLTELKQERLVSAN